MQAESHFGNTARVKEVDVAVPLCVCRQPEEDKRREAGAHEMKRVVKSSAGEGTGVNTWKRARKCGCACVLYGRLPLSPQRFLGPICLFDSECTMHVTLMTKEMAHSVHEDNINHAESS